LRQPKPSLALDFIFSLAPVILTFTVCRRARLIFSQIIPEAHSSMCGNIKISLPSMEATLAAR